MTTHITQQMLDDIMTIRDEGHCNMLDFNCVHREANRLDFHALVVWMYDNKKKWGSIILGDIIIED